MFSRECIFSLHPTFKLYARTVLAWTKKNNNNHSLRNEELQANRASETEEQKKERLRIRRVKDRVRRRTKKTTRGKEKVVRNRRPQGTAPVHSQKIEAG